MVRVGLVGAGYISDFHVQALRRLPGVTIVGIADLDLQRAQAVAARYALPGAYGSLQDLAAAGVDAVHILTPPSSHAVLTLQALELGLHVFVEKPLATSVADCERIAAAAKQAGKSVGVNHSNLRDPIFQQALQTVARGDIGDVLSVTYLRSSNYPAYLGGPLPPQYQEGGYPFRDMGVHALYMLQAFLGEPVDASALFTTKGTDPNLVFDEWSATVRFARGLGQIRLSWNTLPLQNQLIVEGTRGVLRADMFSMYVSVRRKTRLPGSAERILGALFDAKQIATQVPRNVFRVLTGKIRRYHGLQEMVREFYERLESKLPAPVTPEQTVGVVNWTENIAQVADREKRARLAALPQPLTAGILVTGGGGFIGKHLVSKLLARGERIRLLLRRLPDETLLNDPRVEIVVGDLGDPRVVARAVAGTRLVYHLGAAMQGNAADFERGTIVGTQNIVNSVLAQPATKLVYVSSLSVLHAAAAGPNSIVREDWPLEPQPELRGLYTNAKLQAERIVSQAVTDQRLQAVIVRPGQVFGPGTKLMTPAVARQAGKRLLIIGNGRLVLPLIYVDDLVDGMVSAAERDVFDGSVFHLVDAANVTQNELAERYRRAALPQSRIRHIPKIAMLAVGLGVQMAARLLGRKPPLSPYRIASALAPLRFDCTAARNALQWAPRVGVERGLEIMLGSELTIEPAAARVPSTKAAIDLDKTITCTREEAGVTG